LTDASEFAERLHSEMLESGDEVLFTIGLSLVVCDKPGSDDGGGNGGGGWTAVAVYPAGRLVLRLSPVLLDTLVTPLDGLTDWAAELAPPFDDLPPGW
jgi:hypothetical protein